MLDLPAMKEEKKGKYREKFIFKRQQFVTANAATPAFNQIPTTLLEQFLTLPEVQAARKFVSYIPLPTEADVSLINQYLKDKGRKLLLILPKVTAPIPVDLNFEIVIVPLLAFDRTGKRLGQGGGWYDRFIAALEKYNPCICKIGVAFSMQEMADVPVGELDKTLDIIITEKEVIRSCEYKDKDGDMAAENKATDTETQATKQNHKDEQE